MGSSQKSSKTWLLIGVTACALVGTLTLLQLQRAAHVQREVDTLKALQDTTLTGSADNQQDS